jgi:hypothetical protein
MAARMPTADVFCFILDLQEKYSFRIISCWIVAGLPTCLVMGRNLTKKRDCREPRFDLIS